MSRRALSVSEMFPDDGQSASPLQMAELTPNEEARFSPTFAVRSLSFLFAYSLSNQFNRKRRLSTLALSPFN